MHFYSSPPLPWQTQAWLQVLLVLLKMEFKRWTDKIAPLLDESCRKQVWSYWPRTNKNEVFIFIFKGNKIRLYRRPEKKNSQETWKVLCKRDLCSSPTSLQPKRGFYNFLNSESLLYQRSVFYTEIQNKQMWRTELLSLHTIPPLKQMEPLWFWHTGVPHMQYFPTQLFLWYFRWSSDLHRQRFCCPVNYYVWKLLAYLGCEKHIEVLIKRKHRVISYPLQEFV